MLVDWPLLSSALRGVLGLQVFSLSPAGMLDGQSLEGMTLLGVSSLLCPGGSSALGVKGVLFAAVS